MDNTKKLAIIAVGKDILIFTIYAEIVNSSIETDGTRVWDLGKAQQMNEM